MPDQIQLNAWDLTIFIVYLFLAVGLGFTMLFLGIGRLVLALATGRGYPQRRRP